MAKSKKRAPSRAEGKHTTTKAKSESERKTVVEAPGPRAEEHVAVQGEKPTKR